MKIFLLVAALVLTATQTQESFKSVGVIEGRVLNSAGQKPLEDVQVTLIGPDTSPRLAPDEGNLATERTADLAGSGIGRFTMRTSDGTATTPLPQQPTLTDNEGRFHFKNLEPGRYSLRVQLDGYFGPATNGKVASVVTKDITLDVGPKGAAADFLLTRGGIVSGHVRDLNGKTVPGMTVSTYQSAYDSNGRRTWVQGNSKTTDDRGEYRLFWLPPGEYYVGVNPSGVSARLEAQLQANSVARGAVVSPRESWARTFFHGTTEPSAATSVLVKPGRESTDIDIDIQAASTQTFMISGFAVNPYAQPNAAGVADTSLAQFILSPLDPGVLGGVIPPTFPNAIPADLRPNGEFEIRNVRPGLYDIYPYFKDAGANGRYLTSRNPVDLRSADVTGLRISVNPGVDFSGEVVVQRSGGKSIKLDSLRVVLHSRDTMPEAFAAIVGPIQVDANGKFATNRVPEGVLYGIELTGLPEAAYVADIRQGSESVFDRGFVLGKLSKPLQVVVDGAGVTVDGTVRGADGEPKAGAVVVLAPPVARGRNAILYRNATTEATGHFTMKGVAPGSYTVFAWESVLSSAWLNADFLKQYEDRGQPVTVAPSSHPELKVNLIPVETNLR